MEERKAGPGRGVNRGARSGKPDSVIFPSVELDRRSACLVICCVDDTDDLSGDSSTGYVAECIAQEVAGLGGQVSYGVTRHQLLLAEGVPYTSHNSAMALAAYLPEEALPAFEEMAVQKVEAMSVPASDPGLCLITFRADGLEADGAAHRSAVERMVAFGHAAQTRVCTKAEAYQLAASVRGVRLSEHGGTGDGVIGALAGAGLRLGGEDGRFRGSWNLKGILGADGALACEDVCRILADKVGGLVDVVDVAGQRVSGQMVDVRGKAKPVLRHSRLAIVVDDANGVLVPIHKDALDELSQLAGCGAWATCDAFALDGDVEECAEDLARTCRNCLYRRWTQDGLVCVTTASA